MFSTLFEGWNKDVPMRCLLSTLILFSLVGCRSQTTTMTNPFMAPSRVPSPPTRMPVAGTAQPYYQGVPAPNASAYGAPTTGFAPGVPVVPGTQPTSQPTYAPQPGVGSGPPNGWAPAPQPGAQPLQAPYGASMNNVIPNNIQTASAMLPVTMSTTQGQSQVQVQADQQALRFDASAFQHLQSSAAVLPTSQQGDSPYPVQPASYQPTSYQSSVPQFTPSVVTSGQPRAVQIRAVSSDNLSSNSGSNSNNLPSRDGFRPQSSQRVRKPS